MPSSSKFNFSLIAVVIVWVVFIPSISIDAFSIKSVSSQRKHVKSALPAVNKMSQSEAAATTTRRSILAGAGLAIGTTCLMTDSLNEFSSLPKREATNIIVQDAIHIIESKCDRIFLQAVVASDYRFMYRGAQRSDGGAMIFEEPNDLLDPETYNDSLALDFFTKLEQTLGHVDTNKSPTGIVSPSNGHLATTSVEDALQWGDVAVSVWPLQHEGTGNFVWFQDGGLFWPRNMSDATNRDAIIVDGIDCGRDYSLDEALRQESTEVLFRAQQFLAVPSTMDEALREALKKAYLL